MAMPMSSAFTRKKVVTYGRAARLSTAQIFTEDSPSSEPPRKQVGRLPSASQTPGAASGAEDALDSSHTRPQKAKAPRDEFDVPSDNEPTPRAVPVKKSLPKPAPRPVDGFDVFDVPSSGDERKAANHARDKAVQPPRRKIDATRPKAPVSQAKAQDKLQAVAVSSNGPVTTTNPAARIRAKTPVVAAKSSLPTQAKAAKQDAPAIKGTTRPAAPALQAAVKQKRVKLTVAPSAKETVPTPPTEPVSDFAVFDVPSSDDDAPTQTPVRPRKVPIARAKVSSTTPASHTPLSPEPSAESDTSNASHKRKRRGFASSTTKKSDTAQRKREASLPRRSRKYQKTEGSVSPGHAVNEASQPTVAAVIHELPINKPKRTRIRTVPVISRPSIAKAQSSPVKLQNMLAMRSAAKPPSAQEMPEAPITEDDTMYDIPEEVTPLARGSNSTLPGSVTPRQRDLFSNLLEDGSNLATPMPNISKLQLTDRKPDSAIAALTRSSSDIPQSAHTRKGRLIDMLKRAAPSSDDDSEGETTEGSEEDNTDITIVSAVPQPTVVHHDAPHGVAEAMDIDPDTQASSQTPRAPIPIADGSRTYAQQRSYLEESNFEDGLLNWDEDIEVDLADRQSSVTGSEDDSQQVTGLSELRRKGQLYKFEAETSAMIDDISGKSNGNISARRSAIMEFASQMADVHFVEQLLESAMTSSLLRAISTTGDLVFDFAAAVAILFMLGTKPSYAVVEHIYHSDILSTSRKLLLSPMSSFDIHRISKDRKTNMAASARESVAEFRTLILKTLNWSVEEVPKLSPQLLAIKVLEELVIGLRAPGNTDSLVDEDMISRVLDATSGSLQRLRSGQATAQDNLLLETTFSALESLSLFKEAQATWSEEILRRLADMMSVFFEATASSLTRLVIRLCMNLANNRPKTCSIFADETFVTRLTRFIVECFQQLGDNASQRQRTGVREDLILGLGAMMNLAEFSDQARLSVIQGGDEVIGELVKIFLEGSERADRANSLEDSHSLVPIGYLTIMLGNLCLNDQVRRKVTSLLPEKNINLLVQKVKEFVQYNQRVDQAEFEGADGQQALQNFTLRLMLVVERLEKVGV